MYKFFTKHFVALLFFGAICGFSSFAQNSMLVTLGSANCSTPTAPIFSITGNPLGASPSILALCDLSQQLPDYFSSFVAYNPANNNIYICDTRYGYSRIWTLDMGLPNNITCPNIPDSPTYSYNYLPNNFEFDNNGKLWSFRNYNDTTGVCLMDQFDPATGNVLTTISLQFPLANLPSTLSSGDVSILPNGRMFVVFGEPSLLYEITNYNGSGNASATYLQTMPADCFGMAYLDCQLEITGTDEVSSCYYFVYNIENNTLGPQLTYQNGETAIDNTGITPTVGLTKQLVNAVKVNDNTADLTYDVYAKNMGNVILTNINASDNLATAFGAANVSDVSVSFLPGDNNAGLTLNSSYNGTTDTLLLNPGQTLPNRISNDSNYFFEVQITCRVTNLSTNVTYYNSAIGTSNIGNTLSAVNVADSSNNGPPSAVNPSNDGDPGEPGDNVPTPFNFSSLVPVHFISVSASLADNASSIIKWSVATPTTDASEFEVEYSTDGINWQLLTTITITSQNQSNYQYTQENIPAGNIYYRVKEIDNGGAYTLSRVVLLNNEEGTKFVVFPNPANKNIQINAPYGITGNSTLELFDAIGRKLIDNIMDGATTELNTSQLPDGTYLLRIENNENITTQKVLIVH